MARLMKPGERYWGMIDPHWDRVSIYDGARVFLREYRRTPEAARHLLAAHWCQSEVCNGGFHRFFSNSTGMLAPEAAAGFEAIGQRQVGSLVWRAMEFFASSYPRDREERNAALEANEAKHPKAADPFERLDERFYALLDKEAGGWEEAAEAYAKKHGG